VYDAHAFSSFADGPKVSLSHEKQKVKIFSITVTRYLNCIDVRLWEV